MSAKRKQGVGKKLRKNRDRTKVTLSLATPNVEFLVIIAENNSLSMSTVVDTILKSIRELKPMLIDELVGVPNQERQF